MYKYEKKANEVKKHYQATPFDFQKIRGEIFKAGLTYDVLQHYDLSHKNIIDIGCSTSFLGEFMKKNHPDYHYLGIDINPRAVEMARAKGLDVREGNNLFLDLPDNYSDLTVSEGVIHHTPDPFKCFSELIRVTKKGGLISLYVYNRNHIYFFVYKAGFIIRCLSENIVGKQLIEKMIFPLFNVFYVQIGHRLYFKDKENVSKEIAWNIFSDQILTPVAHFFTKRQVINFAENNGLTLMKEKVSINKQGLMFIFKKMRVIGDQFSSH